VEPKAPPDLRKCPRYPLIVVEDIPFTIISFWLLAGEMPYPDEQLDYFAKHGRLRATKLNLPKDPERVVKRLLEPGGLSYYGEPGILNDNVRRDLERLLRNQLSLLLAPAGKK